MKIQGIKTFPIQMTDELNEAIKKAALVEEVPMYQFIYNAIVDRIEKQKSK